MLKQNKKVAPFIESQKEIIVQCRKVENCVLFKWFVCMLKKWGEKFHPIVWKWYLNSVLFIKLFVRFGFSVHENLRQLLLKFSIHTSNFFKHKRFCFVMILWYIARNSLWQCQKSHFLITPTNSQTEFNWDNFFSLVFLSLSCSNYFVLRIRA